jgi:hypothetical protein
MKKLLTLVSVVAVAGAIGTASAMDRTGKFGLGAQESFSTSGGFGSSSLGNWSLKYGISSNLNAQFVVGFDMISKGNDKSMTFGARILYDLVEKENSDFYTGLGIGYNFNKTANAAAVGADNLRVLRISIPLGYEFSFAGLPEVGFSFEAGVVMDYYQDANDAFGFSSVGGNVGGNLGLGVHYYF